MIEQWLYGEEGYQKALPLRLEVFCDEQHYPREKESDAQEEVSWHLLLEKNGETLATGRIVEEEPGVWHFGRIAVKKQQRSRGLGEAVVYAMIAKAKAIGAAELRVSAQTYAIGFYERFGFSVCGQEFMDENLPHVPMCKSLVFDGCAWVGFPNAREAVIAESTVTLASVDNVKLLWCGLGYTHLTVNGKPVDDALLTPAWSNYEKRDLSVINMPVPDTLIHRIYYVEADITSLVHAGENTLSFHIGNGWYGQHESRNEGMRPYGELKLCYKVLSGGETVAVSDENVCYRSSFVTRTNIYFGETHDARLIGSTDRQPVSVLPAPLSVLTKQICPPDREIRTITPKEIYRFGDTAIYDLGENVAGYPKLVFHDGCRRDERAFVRFAEELNADGSLDFHSAGGEFRMQRDEFIFDDQQKDHVFYPLFTWHACRYFEVQGRASVTEYAVVHTDIPCICDYHSDDEMLEWIVQTYLRTQQNNIHNCVPSDCPHRERLGYTGDGQLTCGTVMDCFDAKELYQKWMRDIADSQDIFGGHVEHTAPFYGGGGGPGGWGGAIVFVPWEYYLHYHDKSVLEQYYPNMLKYLQYMETHSENHLVVRSEKGGWCLGDWCTPDKIAIPEPFVNTYFYIKAVRICRQIALLFGNEALAADLASHDETAQAAILSAYYDAETGSFAGGIQGADAFAVDLGLGDERTYRNLLAKYEALGRFDTGIFGTDILVRVLCERGETALAKRLLTSRDGIGTFAYMKDHGATTLWEDWDGGNSHSHPMFGAVVRSIIQYLK